MRDIREEAGAGFSAFPGVSLSRPQALAVHGQSEQTRQSRFSRRLF